jgi:hypothetical protein
MIIQNVYQDNGSLIKASIPNTISYSIKNLNILNTDNTERVSISNITARSQSISDNFQTVTIQNNESTPRIKIFK